MKNVHVPVARQKKITCTSGWILMPQSLDRLHIMLINGIIIIYSSKRIEFNFDWALNTIEFSIRVSYFFVCMENERKSKWRVLKMIDTSFLYVIANLF